MKGETKAEKRERKARERREAYDALDVAATRAAWMAGQELFWRLRAGL